MGQDMRLFKVVFRRHGVAQHADEKKGNKKKKIDLALMGEDMRLFKVVFRRHGVAQHADAVGEQEVTLFIYVWKVCVPPQLVPVCVSVYHHYYYFYYLRACVCVCVCVCVIVHTYINRDKLGWHAYFSDRQTDTQTHTNTHTHTHTHTPSTIITTIITTCGQGSQHAP